MEMTSPSIRKMQDFYNHIPDAPICQQEFWMPDFTLARWQSEGHLTGGEDLRRLFRWDEPAKFQLGGLGWTEAALNPSFEVKVLADQGEHELVQDAAGRQVLFFKGRRSGFMPEYVGHPVQDFRTWEDNIKWRLNPDSPERYADLAERMARAQAAATRGEIICQDIVGGCQYLRSLMGPEGWLYLVADDPELIHACMRSWLILADRICAVHQQYVTFDEIFISEDLCYKAGPLISPAMVREYFFPYYEQLIANVRSRQLDRQRKLHIQIDTDGNAIPVIDLYREIGMDYMSPFEAASGCDVVAVRKSYPDLLIRGGFDKRILAESTAAIDREINRIMPFMKREGGFIPTCDHGVPEEVPFSHYMHYRQRMLEFG